MPRVVPSQAVQVIDTWFPWASQQPLGHPIQAGWIPAIPGLLALLRHIPDDLLRLNVYEYGEFMKCLGELETTVNYWLARDGKDFLPLRGQQDQVTVVRRLLAKCPDEFPAPSVIELRFIRDADYRNSIRQDIEEAEVALQTGRWKGATVSAGTAVEALLLWALREMDGTEVVACAERLRKENRFSRRPDTNLDELRLPDYIELAEGMKLIKPDTAEQARLAKNFRNLIHPGRAVREGQTCDRATARSALAAVDHVVRDLEGYWGTGR